MDQQTGKYIIIAGAIIAIIGLLIYFGGNRLHWIGRLPGDIRVERPGFKFYFPVMTMILLSVVVSLILWIWRRMH